MRVLLFVHMFIMIETKRNKTKSKFPKPIPSFNDDVNSDIMDNNLPIDFLNMGVEGVFDPSLGQKQPFDGIAMYMVHQRKTDEDLRSFLNQLADYRKQHEKPINMREMSKPGIPLPSLFNFELTHSLNLAKPKIYRDRISRTELLFRNGDRGEELPRPERPKNLEEIIPLNAFDMRTGINEDVMRWTTCDDFGKKARFHPRDVAGVSWVPFYMWAMQSYPIPEEFKFSYPTMKVVQEYKQQYASKLTKKIDWTAPMLLLRNWLEMLLVAADRRGLFYGIPKATVTDDVGNSTTWYPHATIRMKMVDQYLAMMFCEEHLAMMLAVVGEAPDLSESAAEAAKLGFHGVGAPVYKPGVISPAHDDRLEELGDRSNLDRHSQVVKSFYTP